MQTKTICCRMVLTVEAREALEETSRCFADACNYVSEQTLINKTSSSLKLHELCYKIIRARFRLSANLAVRSIRRVAAAMTRLRGKRKAPKLFRPKSIDYDARLFYFKDDQVSLRTLQKRFRIPVILGEYQRKALQGKNPTAATVIKKPDGWYIHMVIECEEAVCTGKNQIGIDLGLTNIATTSTNLKIEGQSRQAFKKERAKVRASLQSKGTKGAKSVLKKISGKEKRRIKHENHVLSKKLVEEAKRHDCGIIRMEQLKEIRCRTKTWNKHLNRMIAGWSFYQLQQFVKYKAAICGIAVEFVSPKYTSQTCHKCYQLGSRKGERFYCSTCGESYADINAACVISLGGAVCKPARISNSTLAESSRL